MDIAFKDLASELSLAYPELARLRDKHLSVDEHYKKDGKSWFTETGAEKVRLAVEVPLAVPKKITGVVKKGAPNPRFVYCIIGRDVPVVPVAIPRRLCGRLDGKTITIDVIEDATGGKSYRHESLGN